jgi:GNAT superfamily N-acetyltransferase
MMIRRMQAGDLPSALELTQAENWPHRAEDWEFHHRLGRGWAACDDNGALLGTASWWAYGDAFGSVGLVVVDRKQQGKGIGRQLMEAIIEDAGPRALQLVATNAGLKLYRQCGFREHGGIEQRQGIPALRSAVAKPSGMTLRFVTANDLGALGDLDAAAFGAPRHELIKSVGSAGTGVLTKEGGRLTGFALMRPSGRGTVIGPVVANDESHAIDLIAHLLNISMGFTRIDIPAAATELAAWLDAVGLVRVDQVTTMVRGNRPVPHSSAKTFGLVSQAFS